MQARFAGTIDGHSRRRHKAQPRGDVHNGGVFVFCQQGDEQPGKNDCRLQVNPNFILTRKKIVYTLREIDIPLHTRVVDKNVQTGKLGRRPFQ